MSGRFECLGKTRLGGRMNAIVKLPKAEADQAIIEHLQKGAPLGRRGVLKVTGLAGAGLVLGFSGFRSEAAAAETVLTAYVRIGTDGFVTLYSKAPEMGQGIKTALTMILAEELDADWAKVKVEQAPINTAVYGEQWTTGSRSIETYS